MKLTKLLVLLLIVIWLSAALTYTLYKGYYRKEIINEFDMDIQIVESGVVGLNIDTDKIYFGIVTLGGGSTRHVNLTNSKDYDVFVWAEKDDSILSSIVRIDPNYFTLKANEYESVDVNVKVPEDFEPGNYTGKVTFLKKVPFYRR